MVWNTNMAAVSSFLNTNIWAPWRHVKTLCRRKEQEWTRQSRKALRNMIPMVSNVFWNVKQFRSFQWGHNTLCSKTMLSPKRNSRQLLWKLWMKTRPLWYLWKGPQFLPHPHESKYFRNNISKTVKSVKPTGRLQIIFSLPFNNVFFLSLFYIVYFECAYGGDSIFAGKSALNVSKNKLIRKNAVTWA